MMEGYDWSRIAQRTFTLSFWVKSTKTGIFCVSFTNSGSDRSYVAEYTVNVTDTWEKKTVTIAPSPSAGTWLYTNGRGLLINFLLAAGTNFHSTADSWQTGFNLSTSNQVNAMDSAANNFKLALIQVEAGDTATPFEIRSRGEEMALCQRYYETTYPPGSYPGDAATAGAVTYRVTNAGVSAAGAQWAFATTKRAIPSIGAYSVTGTGSNWRNGSIGADSGGPTAVVPGTRGVFIGNPQVGGDAVGNNLYIMAEAIAEL